jgi:hypothetical protein
VMKTGSLVKKVEYDLRRGFRFRLWAHNVNALGPYGEQVLVSKVNAPLYRRFFLQVRDRISLEGCVRGGKSKIGRG